MKGICGSRGTVGDYKDTSRNMNACMHANHGISIVVLIVMFVKTFEFISQDMIHTVHRSSIQRHKLKGDMCL